MVAPGESTREQPDSVVASHAFICTRRPNETPGARGSPGARGEGGEGRVRGGGGSGDSAGGCSLLLHTTLHGLELQVARQVPQLRDQVTEESPHVLHLLEKKAHLVEQVGIRGLRRRGGAWVLGGGGGRWGRRRPGELHGGCPWSGGLPRRWLRGWGCSRAGGTWAVGRETCTVRPGPR